jgi:hypothetical protein
MDRECLAAQGCEFEYAGQRDDVLRNGIVVPIERRMRRRFLEKNGLRFNKFISLMLPRTTWELPSEPV